MKLFNNHNDIISLENVRRVRLIEGENLKDVAGVTVVYCDSEEESLWCGTKRNGGNEKATKIFNEILAILQEDA